jgi:hypothetical protein
MLFVADRIPAELRGIVEFLNKQMNPAEVLALELRQFEGEGVKTIVPTLYGQTEEAQQKKTVRRGSGMKHQSSPKWIAGIGPRFYGLFRKS